MKSTIEKAKNQEPEYPFLGKSNKANTVVLFTKVGCGVVVHGGNDYPNYPIGEYRTDWIMTAFKRLPDGEKVVLEQQHE